MQKKCLTLIVSLLAFVLARAQEGTSPSRFAQIEGVVIEQGDGNVPVPFAAVILTPSDMSTITDANGVFVFKKVEPGKIGLRVQFIGMETIDTSIVVKPGTTNRFTFSMKVSSFHLEEVTVLATQNKAGKSTASNVSRQAMDHLQSSSLKDIMQLIPGGQIDDPD